ncbi:MAG: tripartite tricarboxylate transporter substrate binding protein [Cupriavidus necator]
MKTIRTRVAAILLCVATLIGVGPTHAADAWPSKPVTIVVAFPPGGATDLIGRLLATELGATFKQSFIVENRPGVGGQLGTEYVARRPNDGYTLLVSATGHVIAPSVQAKVSYHPVRDFEPIALLVTMPNLLVVNPEVPAKTWAEFIRWARTQSNIPYGSAGIGGATHLSGELFRHVTGLPLSHIAYKGASPSILDTIGGQIHVGFQDSVSVSNFVTTGKLRALAVTRAQRSKLFPELPAIAEAGYKDYDLYNWVGLYAPAGTPPNIVLRLNQEVNRIMKTPDVVARMQALGADSGGQLNTQEFRKYVEDEVTKWRKTVQISGVEIIK